VFKEKVVIPQSEIEKSKEQWKFFLVGRFKGKKWIQISLPEN